MAISSNDVKIGNNVTSGSILYNLWGNLCANDDATWTKLLGTINVTGVPLILGDLRSLSASFSRSPASLTWTPGVYGNKTVTITANCAWHASIAGSANFSLNGGTTGTVALIGSGGSGTYGGNGSVIVTRASVPGTYSGTVTIVYSNGAGGQSSTTVTLSAT